MEKIDDIVFERIDQARKSSPEFEYEFRSIPAKDLVQELYDLPKSFAKKDVAESIDRYKVSLLLGERK